jgi:sugar-specific transcriptional regulator TrmB
VWPPGWTRCDFRLSPPGSERAEDEVKGTVSRRKVTNMAEPKDMRQKIEHLIERAQDELMDASRELANGISRETERFVPPVSNDIERLVDEVFDFAERVIKGQRKMVGDVVKTINEQTDRAAQAGRTATQRVTKKGALKKGTAARKSTGTKAAAKKTAAKKTVAKKSAAAKKAPAKRVSARR